MRMENVICVGERKREREREREREEGRKSRERKLICIIILVCNFNKQIPMCCQINIHIKQIQLPQETLPLP